MNRIERLLWEETQLEAIERPRRKSHGTKAAKVLSIAIMVGLVALLASRLPIPPLDDAVARALAPASLLYTPVGAPKPAREAGPAAAASPRDTAGEVGKTDPHDELPAAGSAHEPPLRGRESFVVPSSPVETSIAQKRM